MTLEKRLSDLEAELSARADQPRQIPFEIPAVFVHPDDAQGPCRCEECEAEWARVGGRWE
jgi:hypothetical protein